jgi:hypothetical protein
MIVCVCVCFFFFIFRKLHSWVFLNNFFASAILHEFCGFKWVSGGYQAWNIITGGSLRSVKFQCFVFGRQVFCIFFDLKIMILTHAMDFCEKKWH